MTPAARVRGFWILNILRYFNILSLLTGIAASWAVLIKSFVVTKFFFFDGMNTLILSLICLFLVLSELSLFQSYISRNWPLFSQQHGLVALGLAEVMVGFQVLGGLNEGVAKKKELGGELYTLLLSSGIIILIMGVLGFILSYVYRDKAAGLSARGVRSWSLRRRLASRPPTPACPPSPIMLEKAESELSLQKPTPVHHFGTRRFGTDSEYGSALPGYVHEGGVVRNMSVREVRMSGGDGWRPPVPRSISVPPSRGVGGSASVYTDLKPDEFYLQFRQQ